MKENIIRASIPKLDQIVTFLNIMNIFNVGPLLCQDCGGEMKVIVFIGDPALIRKILKHLDRWVDQEPRPPPTKEEAEAVQELEYIPCFD